MKQFGLGLVVGKFAPLHRGHEALFAMAAARCHRLLLLSYAVPEPPGCPAELRAQWLKARAPEAESVVLDDERLRSRCASLGVAMRPMVPDSAPGPEHWAWLAWCLGTVLRAPVDAMLGNETYVRPCAAHLSAALLRPVDGVVFDLERRQVPISASAVRGGPDSLRHWLAPEVDATWFNGGAGPSVPAAPAAPP